MGVCVQVENFTLFGSLLKRMLSWHFGAILVQFYAKTDNVPNHVLVWKVGHILKKKAYVRPFYKHNTLLHRSHPVVL
jgi:hypothetical protein